MQPGDRLPELNPQLQDLFLVISCIDYTLLCIYFELGVILMIVAPELHFL